VVGAAVAIALLAQMGNNRQRLSARYDQRRDDVYRRRGVATDAFLALLGRACADCRYICRNSPRDLARETLGRLRVILIAWMAAGCGPCVLSQLALVTLGNWSILDSATVPPKLSDLQPSDTEWCVRMS
jgi:hypothetical protein